MMIEEIKAETIKFKNGEFDGSFFEWQDFIIGIFGKDEIMNLEVDGDNPFHKISRIHQHVLKGRPLTSEVPPRAFRDGDIVEMHGTFDSGKIGTVKVFDGLMYSIDFEDGTKGEYEEYSESRFEGLKPAKATPPEKVREQKERAIYQKFGFDNAFDYDESLREGEVGRSLQGRINKAFEEFRKEEGISEDEDEEKEIQVIFVPDKEDPAVVAIETACKKHSVDIFFGSKDRWFFPTDTPDEILKMIDDFNEQVRK